jgi:Leucine-rich repeat (LRR) protein
VFTSKKSGREPCDRENLFFSASFSHRAPKSPLFRLILVSNRVSTSENTFSEFLSKLIPTMSIALHYSFRPIDHQSPCNGEQIAEDRVEQVYLKFCDLEKFPEWLTRLENLTHINISCNLIEQVPSSLNLLKNLNYLDMSDNRLMTLAPTLFDLTQLRYLDVSGNFIEKIPTGECRPDKGK